MYASAVLTEYTSPQYHDARLRNRDPVAELWSVLGFLTYWSSRLRLERNARILDVGCAEGTLVELARNLGFEATGIDISGSYSTQWAMRGIDARVAEIHEISGQFDLVITRQVIEHVREPAKFFDGCSRILGQGGSLLVETGDPTSAQARILGSRWSYWIPEEGIGAHISFLGPTTVDFIARNVNLSLRESVPSFRYRPFATYRRGQNRFLALALFALHRTNLSSGRCYWLVKD